ncbi:MAG: hypothetical protein ABFR95_06765 [Actinomycetota bacterium]
MSHDSGFRRNDHDSTHRPTTRRQKGSKASRAYEERLARRHKEHVESKETDTEAASDR